MQTFDAYKWERAAILVAQRLAAFRCGPDLEPNFNEDDMLRAGHIIGALWANDLINFSAVPNGKRA
jgi:hypothetical protein